MTKVASLCILKFPEKTKSSYAHIIHLVDSLQIIPSLIEAKTERERRKNTRYYVKSVPSGKRASHRGS